MDWSLSKSRLFWEVKLLLHSLDWIINISGKQQLLYIHSSTFKLKNIILVNNVWDNLARQHGLPCPSHGRGNITTLEPYIITLEHYLIGCINLYYLPGLGSNSISNHFKYSLCLTTPIWHCRHYFENILITFQPLSLLPSET